MLEKIFKPYRIGSLEVRRYAGTDNQFEIVKWSDNDSYHSTDYEWDDSKQMYRNKNNPIFLIDKSSYEAKEYCFVISFLDLSENYSLKERKILERYHDLSDDEKKNYQILSDYVFHMVKNKSSIKNGEIDNPIIDGRIVSDKTFATRFKHFLRWFEPKSAIEEEELEYMKYVADRLLKYQKATIATFEEQKYFENLKKR